MKSCAIYARVSTSDQVKGTSLDGQVALCQDYATAHGFMVVKVMQEDMSGARLDRPKLSELRDLAQRREIDALIVSEQDRLSRSLAHTLLLLDEFQQRRVEVIFISGAQRGTPEGDMMSNIEGAFKEWERTKILERTRRGRERRIKDGQVMMSARFCPYGYTYSERRLEINETEARWVAKMFEWAAVESCTLREIGRRLNAGGAIPKCGADHWRPETIRALLQNEVYAGTWHYGKRSAVEAKQHIGVHTRSAKSSWELNPRSEWLSVNVPAIVPQSLYDAILGRWEHNKAMSSRNAKYPYLLRGMITCSRCGLRMYGASRSHPKSDGSPRLYYLCSNRHSHQKHLPLSERCTQPGINAEKLETLLWDEVVTQLSDEKVLKAKMKAREAELRRGRKDDETELEVIINGELGLKREADKLLDYAMSDLIDKDTLRERMGVIREKQEALAKSKSEVTARLAQWEQSPASEERIKELCKIAKRGLPYLTFEEKRAFLEGMDVKLRLDGNKVTITGLITERTLTLADKGSLRSDNQANSVLCHRDFDSYRPHRAATA